MMSRFYKKIESSIELKAYDDVAAAVGAQAVGISASGALYKWDRHGKKVEKINSSEALEILKVNPEQLEKIIETRGAYVIDAPVEIAEAEVPLPVIETPADVEPAIAEAPVEEEKKYYHVNLEGVKDLKFKSDVDLTVSKEILKTVGTIAEAINKAFNEVFIEEHGNYLALSIKLDDLESAVKTIASTVEEIKKAFILE